MTYFGIIITIKKMARPKKQKNRLMSHPLRIMLTADQKSLIAGAAKLEGVDMTAWARPILLRAARELVENGKKKSDRQ